LLALSAAVLVAHALLLQPPRGTVQPARERTRALVTRTVPPPELPVPAAALAIASTTPAAPAPSPPPARARPAARPVTIAAAPTAAAAMATPPATPKATEQAAFAVAPSTLLHYKIKAQTRGITLEAQSRLHWRHDGEQYEAKLELSGAFFPTRTQQSTGRITAQGLAPLRFSDKARREEAAHFQREEGKVSFSSNRPDATLGEGAQDRLSVMLQLGAMIAGQPRNFGPGTTISIQTASVRDAEVWQFTIEGEEALQLPGGELNTLKLIRNPRKEFDQKIELWLAPGMAYVPVRLRLTQPNGDWVDQQWSSTDKG
jgi:hypothetical protein